MPTSQAYDDLNGSPADGSPAAHRQQLRAKLAQMPAAVDRNGNPIKPPAEPVVVPNAADFTDPALTLSVIKAAEDLGIDYATATGLLDSRAFVDQVTNAAPAEIAAAISARVSPAPRMAPNRAQGASGVPVPEAPKSLSDTIREKSRSIAAI